MLSTGNLKILSKSDTLSLSLSLSLCIAFFSLYIQLLMLFIHCGCQAKIPDIEKCLDIVATLQAKKGTGEVRLEPVFP